jgi:hypothetical protein
MFFDIMACLSVRLLSFAQAGEYPLGRLIVRVLSDQATLKGSFEDRLANGRRDAMCFFGISSDIAACRLKLTKNLQRGSHFRFRRYRNGHFH